MALNDESFSGDVEMDKTKSDLFAVKYVVQYQLIIDSQRDYYCCRSDDDKC